MKNIKFFATSLFVVALAALTGCQKDAAVENTPAAETFSIEAYTPASTRIAFDDQLEGDGGSIVLSWVDGDSFKLTDSADNDFTFTYSGEGNTFTTTDGTPEGEFIATFNNVGENKQVDDSANHLSGMASLSAMGNISDDAITFEHESAFLRLDFDGTGVTPETIKYEATYNEDVVTLNVEGTFERYAYLAIAPAEEAEEITITITGTDKETYSFSKELANPYNAGSCYTGVLKGLIEAKPAIPDNVTIMPEEIATGLNIGDETGVGEGTTYTSGAATITFIKDGTTETRTWSSCKEIRVYKNASFSISSEYDIVKIDFDGTTSAVTADCGKFASTVWTGSSKCVTFTATGKGTVIKGIKVFFSDGESGGTTDPGTDPDDNASLTLEGDNGINGKGTFVVSNATFEYTDMYYSDYYVISKNSDGYLRNLTEMVGLSEIVVTEDYEHYNLTLYVGSTTDACNTKVEYKNSGDTYTYTIATGNKFFKFVNETGYAATCDKIAFTYESLGNTIDSTLGGGTTDPGTDENQGTVFDANDLGYTVNTEVTSFNFGDYSVTFDEEGTNPTKFYTSGNGTVRYYNGCTMTITSTSSAMTEIKFTTDDDAKITTTVGSYDTTTNTWTGNASEVKFKAGGTVKIETITIK